MNTTDRYLLRITCPGRTGLVAAITGFLADQDCFITELSQFDDIQTGQFFCRAEFCKPESGLTPEEFSNRFSTIGERFEMDWKFIDPLVPHRTLILVSKFDHCLNDLLYRKQTGELNIDVTTVASNHPDLEPLARFHQVPFEVLPATRSKLATKAAQEERICDLIEGQGVDLVVLARYMQVLSNELCQNLAGRCINIHHSFLPSFKEPGHTIKPTSVASRRSVPQPTTSRLIWMRVRSLTKRWHGSITPTDRINYWRRVGTWKTMRYLGQ